MIIDILVGMAKFFTKKVCLIILAVVIALGGIIWVVVANYTPKFRSGISEMPKATYVSGNGTASVMVDNYLYFVGGSVKTSEIKYGENEYYAKGKMPDAGIFRVRIDSKSAPVLDYQYDNTYEDEETGEKKTWQAGDKEYNSVVVGVNDWDHIGQKNNGIEAVVPKIAGHDKTAMWVFGKYLIYVSPHNRYDNRGHLMSDYLDFFRVDLDGNHHTLIYTTDSTDLTATNFTVWADSTEKIYLLVSETDNKSEKAETKIKKIDVINPKNVTVLDRNVSNVVLPTATQYKRNSDNENLSQIYGGVMSYVYYTKGREENDSAKGNLLYRCSINGGEPEKIAEQGDEHEGTTFTPLAVTPLDVNGAHANAQFVFAISVTNENSADRIEQELCVITNDNLNHYVYQEPTININNGLKKDYKVMVYANGFCTVDKKLRHYEINDGRIILDRELLPSVDVESVVAVLGDVVYARANDVLYAVNKNGTSNTISLTVASTNTTVDDETGEVSDETVTSEITLPVAVLYQPQGNNTDEPIIFVQDADYIRLYHANRFRYLRFKN